MAAREILPVLKIPPQWPQRLRELLSLTSRPTQGRLPRSLKAASFVDSKHSKDWCTLEPNRRSSQKSTPKACKDERSPSVVTSMIWSLTRIRPLASAALPLATLLTKIPEISSASGQGKHCPRVAPQHPLDQPNCCWQTSEGYFKQKKNWLQVWSLCQTHLNAVAL